MEITLQGRRGLAWRLLPANIICFFFLFSLARYATYVKYAPTNVARVPGILTAIATLSLVLNPPLASLVPVWFPSSACDFEGSAGVTLGGDSEVFSANVTRVVGENADEAEVGRELVEDA